MSAVNVVGPFVPSISKLLLSLVLVSTLVGRAQKIPAASRSTDINVFGGFTANPAVLAPGMNLGTTVGVAMTRYMPFIVSPGFEARAVVTNGPDIRESAYLAGPRAQLKLGQRFSPYADLMFGRGFVHANNPSPGGPVGASALISAWGVGLDSKVFRQFDLKLDYQAQVHIIGLDDVPKPMVVTVGVTYHIRLPGTKARPY